MNKMAFRSITGLTCQAIRAVKAMRHGSEIPVMARLNSGLGRIQISSIHTYRALCVLDKDVREKNVLIKTAITEKQEMSFPNDDGVDVSGLTEAGITIPTLETHAMIIDGVRYDELPVVHIHCSPNNTIMIVTDHTGRDILGRSSCGAEGFKNVKKSTNVAAQATGLSVGTKMVKNGVQTVRIAIKGIGAGRLASIKGLQMSGLNIVSITDRTHVSHGGPKPRKARRL